MVNKRLKFIPSNHTYIRDSFIQLPEHYRFSIEGQDYMVIGGCWYIDSNGFLATPNNNKNMIRPYYVINSGNERAVKQDMAAKTVLSHVPADGVPINNQSFYWKKGTGIRGFSSSHNYFSNANHSQYFPFEKETIVYIPNANTSFTGIAQGGTVCYNGKAYDGYFLGRNGLMQTVKNGKIQSTFSGTLTKYFDEKSGKLISIPTSAYRKGKPVSGWVTNGGEYVYGYYNSLGRLDENKNYWVKQGKKKWYYLEKGRIYRRKDRKRGIAQKPLSSKNLNFYGNSKATPGKFYLKNGEEDPHF